MVSQVDLKKKEGVYINMNIYIYNIDKLWMKVMCNEEHMVTMNASVYIWNVSNGGLILE